MNLRIAMLQLTAGTFNSNISNKPNHNYITDKNFQPTNLSKAINYCKQAAALGSDIALLPECWNIGDHDFDPSIPYSREIWLAQGISKNHKFYKTIQNLAKELGMAIAIPYLESYKHGVRGVVSLIDRFGKTLMTYAKVHTCDFTYVEAEYTPGDKFPTCDLETKNGVVRIGAMICYDREHPESARILMLKGAEIILVPNACKLNDMRIMQLRTRAYENCVGIAMTNYAEPQYNGRSIAINADGHIIFEANGVEGVYVADFNLAQIRERRSITIWGGAFRRARKYRILSKHLVPPIFERKNIHGQRFDPSKR